MGRKSTKKSEKKSGLDRVSRQEYDDIMRELRTSIQERASSTSTTAKGSLPEASSSATLGHSEIEFLQEAYRNLEHVALSLDTHNSAVEKITKRLKRHYENSSRDCFFFRTVHLEEMACSSLKSFSDLARNVPLSKSLSSLPPVPAVSTLSAPVVKTSSFFSSKSDETIPPHESGILRGMVVNLRRRCLAGQKDLEGHILRLRKLQNDLRVAKEYHCLRRHHRVVSAIEEFLDSARTTKNSHH